MSSLRIAALFVLALSLLSQAVVHGDPAKPCNPDICKLPDCFCSGIKIPGDLSASSIPQIVFVTSDAAINTAFYDYERLFDGTLKNPNGCNISGTFFVSHEYTDYCEVQDLYSQRHEIADNSISRRLPISWWSNATEDEQTEEIGGMREILRKWGNVKAEDVKGYRAPYIQVGGNTEFKVLKKLGFMYESSMPTQNFVDPPALWPYTLDYRSTQDCQIRPCPTDSFPGLWEVPLVDYYDKEGQICNFVVSCAPPDTVEEVIELFESNFQIHYTTNRAPFFMLLEPEWLQNGMYFEGTKEFLRKLTSMGDVWIVTVSQGLAWIMNPTTLDKIEDFEPWKCDSPAPPACPVSQCKVCYYPDPGRVMRTCAPACPPHYPWVGNPDGN